MPLERDSHRIVIAGASSLLGVELKSLLEESRFAAADFRLLDEEIAAGTLTEARGEATVIQPVEEGSFDRARFVFFTGSAQFNRANAPAAQQSGATLIDLSGALAEHPEAVTWFGGELRPGRAIYVVPSAAATAAAALVEAVEKIGAEKWRFVFFQPVSEAGKFGIEELESQTKQLLSFQSIGKPVFDTQVAFSMLDAFGLESVHKLVAVRDRIQHEIRALLSGRSKVLPAVEVLHAPVFYGITFSASVVLPIPDADPADIARRCKQAGLLVMDEIRPSNVSAAGENFVQITAPRFDTAQPGTWWFWGAADNIRLPAANAVKLADKLAS